MAAPEDKCRSRERALVAEFQRAYADAVLAGAPREAEAVVREAIDAGLDEAVIDDGVITPVLRLVGDLWADGELTVAQEHLATSISLRVLTLYREAFRVARARSSHRVVLSGVQGEQHVVGLHMAASLLLGAGYDVRLFGPDLPVAAIADMAAWHDPVVVGFTTATDCTALLMPEVFAAVRAAVPDVGILVGGRAVDPTWEIRYDVVVCTHVAEVVADVDALVRRAHRN